MPKSIWPHIFDLHHRLRNLRARLTVLEQQMRDRQDAVDLVPPTRWHKVNGHWQCEARLPKDGKR